MRADRVEVSWDASKASWLVQIINGEEVIRRHFKLARDANEQMLQSTAHQALIDEGFEAQLVDGPATAAGSGKMSWGG